MPKILQSLNIIWSVHFCQPQGHSLFHEVFTKYFITSSNDLLSGNSAGFHKWRNTAQEVWIQQITKKLILRHSLESQKWSLTRDNNRKNRRWEKKNIQNFVILRKKCHLAFDNSNNHLLSFFGFPHRVHPSDEFYKDYCIKKSIRFPWK